MSFRHRARKRFGQNFLVDGNIIARMIRAIAPEPGQQLVEIGPGLGALTLPLLQAVGRLQAVELDRDLVAELARRCQGAGELVIHQGDALRFDFASLRENEQPLRIVGNLPYNISTPLIFHLLDYADIIADMHFTLQKEVVDRLAARVGDDAYGRLSVMVQSPCRVERQLNTATAPVQAHRGERRGRLQPSGRPGFQPAPQDAAQHPQGPARRGADPRRRRRSGAAPRSGLSGRLCRTRRPAAGALLTAAAPPTGGLLYLPRLHVQGG